MGATTVAAMAPHLPPRLLACLAGAALAVTVTVTGQPADAAVPTATSACATTLRVATFNVNFALPPWKVNHDLDTLSPHADVVLDQEAKNVTVDRLFGTGWHTHQNLQRRDQRGTSVAWRVGTTRGAAGYALGVRPSGTAMLTRWISWTDLHVGGRTLRFASTHRPPPRYSGLWPRFDAAVGDFVHRSPYPVVLGLDSNSRDHGNLERRTGLSWSGPSIDGFLTDLPLGDVHALPRGWSDHHAVVGDLTVRQPGCPA